MYAESGRALLWRIQQGPQRTGCRMVGSDSCYWL